MTFKKYNSIDNHYNNKVIQAVRDHFYDVDTDWVCTEKIHGANFSFWTDGTTVRCGKRSGFIGENENFNNWQYVYDLYADKVLHLYDCITRHNAFVGRELPPKEIQIFGEIFGGEYPHPDVARVPNAVRVQKGVFYCPHNDVRFFDLCIDGEYTNIDTMHYHMNRCRLPYAKTIFRGEFDECLNYSCEFESKIHEEYDLPKIENNFAEGFVLRPVAPLCFNRGVGKGERVILKKKHPNFSEIAKAPRERINQDATMTPEQENILDEISCFITENRLDNVLSKIGEITTKDFGKLQGAMMKDILDEFVKCEDQFATVPVFVAMGKSDRRLIQKSLQKKVATFIRPKFIDKINE